jgi:hypothetical protein
VPLSQGARLYSSTEVSTELRFRFIDEEIPEKFRLDFNLSIVDMLVLTLVSNDIVKGKVRFGTPGPISLLINIMAIGIA